MAEVIGTDESKLITKICRNCASVVRFSRAETRPIKHNCDWLGDCDVDDGINCPSCGAEIFVKGN